MAHRSPDTIRNLVFGGHGSAGKTALVDHLLIKTGAVHQPAGAESGASICDFDEEEKHHKYTIESKVVHFEHGGLYFQAIDTPGYPDYIGQAFGALRAAETAVIVINAHSGIEVNTRRIFQEASKAALGRMIVISKMDTDNINFASLLESIQSMFGAACIPLNVPLGAGHDFRGVAGVLDSAVDAAGALVNPADYRTPLIEAAIEHDEEATARYFDGVEPPAEDIPRLVREAVAQGALVPIVCLSTRTGGGVPEFLDALTLCALPPTMRVVSAVDAQGQSVEVTCDPAGPLVAQVFKTRIDPFVQKLSFVRIYSGHIKKDDTVHISHVRKGVKLHQLLRVQANHTEPIEEASAGEIFAVAKTEDLHTGSTLGDYELPAIKFPTPMVGLAVTPKSRGDEGKLSNALHKVVEEDPTLRIDRDSQTKELVMTGMSELHLQIVRERLKRRDKVEVETHEPKIPYRETIQAQAEGSYRHKKQTGGRGQFGEVHIRMHPFPEGTNVEEFVTKERFPSMREHHYDPNAHFVWVDSVVGGTIPNNFLPAVEKGFKERLERGVIAGYKVQNVAVEVYFGKHHPVDSSEAAFKTAGSMAFRNVFQQARPGLLEPIVHLHVTVPSGKVGDINSDLSGRRGRVLGMEAAGGDLQTITAEVPLAEVTTYARNLSSITGGLGSFTLEFNRYDLVPPNIQKEIVDKTVMAKEEEEE